MYRTVADNVLVEPEYEEKAGSIVFVHARAARQGRVITKGEGKVDDNGVIQPLVVEEGQVVVFGTGYTPVKVDGKTLFVMSEDNIFGIID